MKAAVIGYFLFVLLPHLYNVSLKCVCVCRCAAAYVLLAEEEATTITEAERLFRKALTIGGCVFLSSVSTFIPT